MPTLLMLCRNWSIESEERVVQEFQEVTTTKATEAKDVNLSKADKMQF